MRLNLGLLTKPVSKLAPFLIISNYNFFAGSFCRIPVNCSSHVDFFNGETNIKFMNKGNIMVA